MKKSTKFIKKALALFLVVLISIESFAAVVSDDDGSAFVTKAEFEALKTDFAQQIVNYNTSIDSKIDGAIAQYLSGVNLSTRIDLKLDKNCLYTFPMLMFVNDLWNDADNMAYYSVSTPKTTQTFYQLRADYNSSSPYYKGMVFVDINPNAPQVYQIPKMANDSYNFGQLAGYYTTTNKTEGVDGFIISVGDITGTRQIGTTTYNTRERLTGGYGRDIATYAAHQKGTGTGGGHTYTNDSTSTGLSRTYHYSHIIGYTNDGGTHNPATMDLTRRQVWTPAYCPRARWGAGLFTGIRNINNFGWTYQTFLSQVQTIRNESDQNGWCVNDSYSETPNTNVFNWSRESVVDRVFAGSSNLPAEKLGRWSLTTDPDITLTSRYRARIRNDNTCAQLIGWSYNDAADYYARGLYSFNYDVEPYFVAADNSQRMPANTAYFSKLPAQLVYYYDSNNKKHFMDEGMYLQTFTDTGKVVLKLKFSGNDNVRIDINLSKKPFDYTWTSADNLRFTVGNNEYTTGYVFNTATEETVNIEIDDIIKGDDLYLRWKPNDGSKFCQLDSIEDFYIMAE